eukprot:COSAG02_NODE_6078_length_3816_cov_6.455172_2_plen_38_part_00
MGQAVFVVLAGAFVALSAACDGVAPLQVSTLACPAAA